MTAQQPIRIEKVLKAERWCVCCFLMTPFFQSSHRQTLGVFDYGEIEMTIKELLKDNDRVYFSISSADKKHFLQFAIDEGFKWLNGDEITLNDNCHDHMALTNDMHLAFVPWFAWFHPSTGNVPKYSFAEFLNGKLVEAQDELISSDI